MSRIRTIKPDFFLHEDLADLSALHRLLFIGLWTEADREGRLEDRPRRLKAALLPYDDADVDRMLSDLEEAGFLTRYEAQGSRYIAIPSFGTHQRPHAREAASSIPPPPTTAKGGQHESPGGQPGNPGNQATAPRDNPDDAEARPRQCIGTTKADWKGREGKGRGKEDPPSPPLPRGRPPTEPAGEPAPLAPQSPGPSLPELQEAWNILMPHPPFPRWRELGRDQQRAAKRVRERPMDGPDGWRAVLERIARSPFCRGENDRGWVAGPDFLLRQATARKALEGAYDGASRERRRPPGGIPLEAAPPPELPPEDGQVRAQRCRWCPAVVPHRWSDAEEAWEPMQHPNCADERGRESPIGEEVALSLLGPELDERAAAAGGA